MAVNIHITIIELNALHTKRQNLFQELDAVIHLLMEDRKSGSAGMPRPISYAVFCLKKKDVLQPASEEQGVALGRPLAMISRQEARLLRFFAVPYRVGAVVPLYCVL